MLNPRPLRGPTWRLYLMHDPRLSAPSPLWTPVHTRKAPISCRNLRRQQSLRTMKSLLPHVLLEWAIVYGLDSRFGQNHRPRLDRLALPQISSGRYGVGERPNGSRMMSRCRACWTDRGVRVRQSWSPFKGTNTGSMLRKGGRIARTPTPQSGK